MVLLGWAVGRGSTPLDDWFLSVGEDVGRFRRVLLLPVRPPVLAVVAAVSLVVALWRRQWWPAVAVVVCPVLAIEVTRVLKPVFGRHLEGSLAYPSGHTAALVAVVGMAVLVGGARRWMIAVGVVVIAIGMLGVAMTFHYFTDTLGSLVFASGLVTAAALWGRRDPNAT
jgi:hypothetical protein